MRKVCLLAMMAFGVVSCGSDSSDNDTASASSTKGYARCDIPNIQVSETVTYSMCHDFKGWSESALTQAEADCTDSGELGGAGTYEVQAETAGCSTIGLVGTCSWSTGSNTISTVYSETPSGTAASEFESHCSSAWSGTWTAK